MLGMCALLALRHTLYQQAITGGRGVTRDSVSPDVTHIIVGKVSYAVALTITTTACCNICCCTLATGR
jgi:hypothetical protein